MKEDVSGDKRKRDVIAQENSPVSHELEILNSLPKSGEEYYYMLSKEKRKNVVPFLPMDTEYFERLDVEDKAAFICMSRMERGEASAVNTREVFLNFDLLRFIIEVD